MYQDLHFYVDFNWEKHIDDSSSYFSEIYRIVELAYQHKATVFYSYQQLQDFVTNCNELDENFSQSYGNKLSVLLENAKGKNDNNYLFEVCFSNENTSLNPVKNKSKTIINAYSKNALISVIDDCQPKTLLSIKSATDFEKIEFIVIDNTDRLLQWIQKSIERNFNVSDKHGENGVGKWKDPSVSVLLCNRKEAQQLLNTAIPDFCEKGKQLFNFDINHQTFIEFYREGDNPQNQWHGFHIKTEEWDKRIPNSIKKYFKK
jgi:hypothetical protein